MVKETTAIMVIIVVVVLVVGGALVSLAPKFMDWATDFIEKGFGSSNSTSFSTIGLKLTYADGTEKDFNLEDFSLFPLTILDGGQEVIAIMPYIRTTVEHTITDVDSWRYELTDYDGQVVNMDTLESAYIFQDETRMLEQPTTWTSGQYEDLAPHFWSTQEFEALILEHEELGTGGNYELRLNVDVRVTLFANGAEFSETGSGSTTWSFVWDGEGITSLSVIVATDTFP